jgi:hypothetical protein
LSELTGEQAESDMTSAAPLKPTTTALKALFLNAFTEFLLNIFFPFDQPVWLYRITIMIENDRCQVISQKNYF